MEPYTQEVDSRRVNPIVRVDPMAVDPPGADPHGVDPQGVDPREVDCHGVGGGIDHLSMMMR